MCNAGNTTSTSARLLIFVLFQLFHALIEPVDGLLKAHYVLLKPLRSFNQRANLIRRRRHHLSSPIISTGDTAP